MKKIVFNWAKKYQIHFFVWSIFIFYETVVIGMITGYFGNTLSYISHYSINIGIFYLNALLLMPWAMSHKRYSKYWLPAILLGQIAFYILISFATDKGLWKLGVIINLKLDQQFILRSIYRSVYFLGFSTGYYFIVNYLEEKRVSERLRREKLKDLINRQQIHQELSKAQNAFLKAQINPHFLFNTLDFIYHSTLSNPVNASEAVILLSKMMRFAIDADHQGDFILLHEEMEQVGNLIDLYQLRSSHKLNIDFRYDNEISDLNIIPLIVLTVVENIFKHGNTKSSCPVLISLEIKNGFLIIYSSNIVNSDFIPLKGNTGLKNLKKRLEYAYGKEQRMFYQQKGDRFELSIRISIEKMHPNFTGLSENKL